MQTAGNLTANQVKYYAYLESDVWKEKRRQVLIRDGGCCRLCNSRKKTQVHHRAYPEIYGTEPLSDLITLCEACHDLFHSASKIDYTGKGKKPKSAHKPPRVMDGSSSNHTLLTDAKEMLRKQGIQANGNMKRVAKIICKYRNSQLSTRRLTKKACANIVARYLKDPYFKSNPDKPQEERVIVDIWMGKKSE